MRDFTAGHVSSDEAAALLATLQAKLGSDQVRFLPGVSYRNLLIVTAAPFTHDTRTTPPHDLTDQTILDGYPAAPAATCWRSGWAQASRCLPIMPSTRPGGKPESRP